MRLGHHAVPDGSFKTFNGLEMPGDPSAGIANRRAWLPLVWKGKLPLFGVLPRTEEQLEALDPDWKNLLRHAPVGVFSYADSQGQHSPSDPDEALHAVYQASMPPGALSQVRSNNSSKHSNDERDRHPPHTCQCGPIFHPGGCLVDHSFAAALHGHHFKW